MFAKLIKTIVGFIVKAAFIAAAFTLLFRPETFGLPADKFGDISVQSLVAALRDLDTGTAIFWLALAAVVKLGGIGCAILRWRLLLKGQQIVIPFWYLCKMFFMGRAIGLFLPGTTGLDGYRLVESARLTGETIKCATVIAVEKLTGFIALFGLVFLTLPLGLRLFDFNLVMLSAVLVVLGGFVTVSFILLFNPRVIQVAAAILPTPRAVRDKVNKLGIAVTAYSGDRMLLVKALGLAFGVHLAICFIYFGTANAMRADNIGVLDILFAAPLFIVGSVLTPTVTGAGVREVVFVTALGAKAGSSKALIFGHLGLWVGDVFPFLLSLPLILFATRPDKTQFLADLEKARATGFGSRPPVVALTPEQVRAYRLSLVQCLLAGLAAGLIGGAAVGLLEAAWHMNSGAQFNESSAYLWAPIVYGACGLGIGFGVALGLTLLYLMFDRFVSGAINFGFSIAGTLFLLGLPIALFRYRRDVLAEHAMTAKHLLMLTGSVALAAVVVAIIAWGFARMTPRGFLKRGMATVAAFLLFVAIGGVLTSTAHPTIAAVEFRPPVQARGPNIILIAVDTLRADFLSAFTEGRATTETPSIDALAKDGVIFPKTFAQSSWTKASFGTIFTGLYPEAHTATSKISSLPDEVVTFPEVLQSSGYYTKGFSNNPNIESLFNYDQGFVDYTDLKPDLMLWARPSAQKLVLYDVLRKIKQVINAKVLRGRISIADFYQPADIVTAEGLKWLDSDARPGDVPFFLFLHYMDPHDPFRDPDRPGKGYARAQLGDKVDPEKYREAFVRSYTFEIEYFDRYMGELIAGLKRRGLYDDSIIVFTSDHGEEFHEHGGWWHGMSLYDEQIAVPLIIKLPGNALAGSVNPYITRHVDLAPSVLRLAQVEPDAAMQGQSLFAAENAPGNAEVTFSHAHLDFEGIQLKSIRAEDRKLITANEGNKRNYAPVELYDLEADPGEQENIAGTGRLEETELVGLLDDMDAFIKKNAAEPAHVDRLDGVSQQLIDIGYL